MVGVSNGKSGGLFEFVKESRIYTHDERYRY